MRICLLGGPFDDDDGRGGPGGWWMFVEVDVALSEHEIVRPDLAGWRRERLPRPGTTRPIDVVPDWFARTSRLLQRIAPFEAIELELGRLFLPRDADE